MKLGLLTAAFPDTPPTEGADWAAGNGFPALEVACGAASSGPRRTTSSWTRRSNAGRTARSTSA